VEKEVVAISEQNKEGFSTPKTSSWTLVPCEVPNLFIDPALYEQFGEHWNSSSVL